MSVLPWLAVLGIAFSLSFICGAIALIAGVAVRYIRSRNP